MGLMGHGSRDSLGVSSVSASLGSGPASRVGRRSRRSPRYRPVRPRAACRGGRRGAGRITASCIEISRRSSSYCLYMSTVYAEYRDVPVFISGWTLEHQHVQYGTYRARGAPVQSVIMNSPFSLPPFAPPRHTPTWPRARHRSAMWGTVPTPFSGLCDLDRSRSGARDQTEAERVGQLYPPPAPPPCYRTPTYAAATDGCTPTAAPAAAPTSACDGAGGRSLRSRPSRTRPSAPTRPPTLPPAAAGALAAATRRP